MNWTFIDFMNLAASMIVSVGGAGVIILALSKWFGDFMANRLLQGKKFSHEKELEEIKSKYTSELEKTKSELEKSKSLFQRYSEKQFELYNNLWKVLWDLKKKADELWENADPQELPGLSKKVWVVKEAVNINVLIIEEVHFEQLLNIVKRFEDFEFGKKQLVQLRNKSAHQVQEIGVSQEMVRQVIEKNRATKQDYDQLISDLAISFRNQIKG